MKKHLFILLQYCLLTCWSITGCSKESTGTENVFSIANEQITLDNSRGTGILGIRSSSAWQLSCDAAWIAFTPEEGNGSAAVSYEYDPNTSPEPRSAVVTITGTHDRTVTVTLTQEALTTLFRTDVSQLDFPARNEAARSFTLTTDTDFTIDCTAGWLDITDAEGNPLRDGTAAQSPVTICVRPISNIEGRERHAEITLTPANGTPAAIVPVIQSGESFLTGTTGFPATWWINSGSEALTATFATAGYVPASNGSAAAYTYVRTAGNQRTAPVKYLVESSGNTKVMTGGDGDSWLFSVPVESLPAGNAVDLLLQLEAGASAPKYFVVEYLDNGGWKSAGELKTAPEDPSVRYTARTYSNGDVPVKISETFAFTQSFTNENILIRCRQAGNIRTGNGKPLDLAATHAGAACGIAKQGVSLGPQIRYFGGPIPAESKKVLFIGNSYTYYNASYSLLKEMAWREGRYIRPTVFTHGSYSMADALANPACMDMVDYGAYDYAFIQDQSLSYALMDTADDPGYAAGLQRMMEQIREKSPGCRFILEMVWARKNGLQTYPSYPWMATYADMQDREIENAVATARSFGVATAPIGAAWRRVRSERPDIELYYSDGSHPSYAGTYLKCCVNYLTLFGAAFGDNPVDGDLDAATAAYLRSVAEQVVLGHEADYNIARP